MHRVYANRDFAVFDNFLTETDFHALWKYVQIEDYRFINSGKWEKIYRLGSGSPLEGALYLSKAIETDKGSAGTPNHLALQTFIQIMLQHSEDFAEWIGEHKKLWDFFTVRAFLYPQGTMLSWHDDGRYRTGAYAFYVHPKWNIHWGGELLIAESCPDEVISSYKDDLKSDQINYLDNTLESEILMNPGFGHYVVPKPNRLVVFSSGLMHMIKRVELSAGDHVRASITGFFIKLS